MRPSAAGAGVTDNDGQSLRPHWRGTIAIRQGFALAQTCCCHHVEIMHDDNLNKN
jgi:hypothetical protein